MVLYKIEWRRIAYSYVKANSEKEAFALVEEGKDFDFEDIADTYGEDVAGWRIVGAEAEE